MADDRYYQAKAEREAYLRSVTPERTVGWCTASANARVHQNEYCHAIGGHRTGLFRCDNRYVLVHRLLLCPFCNQPRRGHEHDAETCTECRRLWEHGYATGEASILIEQEIPESEA